MLRGRILRCRFRREMKVLEECVESDVCSSVIKMASSWTTR